jgi:hypothetical protein
MSSRADALLQLAKGNVPPDLTETPDTVTMQSVPPAAQLFCHHLKKAYPGMQMTVTLQEKPPLRIETPPKPHRDLRDRPYTLVEGPYNIAREKVLSSETAYTLQRQRRLHEDTLALPDDELQRRVAKRMRVDARTAARRVADVDQQPAPRATQRAGVEIVDESAVHPRHLVKLTTHVSSAQWLHTAAIEDRPHDAGNANRIGRATQGQMQRVHTWDQSVHDSCSFAGEHQGGAYCGAKACAEPGARDKHRQNPKAPDEATQKVRDSCLRCRMAVVHVPRVMLEARAHMGNDCWEDGLTVVLQVGYAVPCGPGSIVMRVQRGPPCPPVEEAEPEPAQAEPPAAAQVCGDEEL